MTIKSPGRREFAQLVSNHVLADENRDELLAVVDGKGGSDEFGQDSGPARPSLDNFAVASIFSFRDLVDQMVVNKWPFF
ncbi:conserved hypothetical protein [Syntrophobacter sp. SbD1]|nr:conserved hypothetical protein [Syntrophobacter sp. SbD1]